jgi:Zn-dependent M28 family amino/carboxypeptidase
MTATGDREMKFIPWLVQQKRRNDRVGDLARDVFRDANIQYDWDVRQLYQYLTEIYADDDVLTAAEKAINEYIRIPNNEFTEWRMIALSWKDAQKRQTGSF